VKLIVPEPGSRQARQAWETADRIVSSSLLYVEARSALAAAVRAGRLPRALRLRARARLERHWRDIDAAAADEPVVLSASDLAESHALRGYDAVHLASALALADEELVLVSADRELLAAASATGIATLPAV